MDPCRNPPPYCRIRAHPQHPLRKTVAATSGDVGQELGGAMAMPAGPDTYEEFEPIVRTPPR